VRETNLLKKKAALLATSSLTVMSGATIAPSLPQIKAHFAGADHLDLLVSLVLTAPALVIALTAGPAGWLVDRVGRLVVLVFGLVLFAAAGSSGLWVDSLPALVVGRAFLGLAVAFVMTPSTTLIADYFQGPQRQGFMGVQSAFMSLGGVAFLICGGLLADWHWRGPFAVYLVALPVLAGALFWLDEKPRDPVQGEAVVRPPTHWQPIVSLYLVGFVGMALFYLVPVRLPFHLTNLTGASPTLVGLAMGVSTVFAGLTSLNYRRLRRVLDYRQTFAASFLLQGMGYMSIGVAGGYAGVLVGLAVMGTGFGMMMPNLNVWLADKAPEWIRGRVFGGLTSAVFLGQFSSPIITMPLVEYGGLAGPLGVYAVAGGVTVTLGIAFAGVAWRHGRRLAN
jgi:MFS family permease